MKTLLSRLGERKHVISAQCFSTYLSVRKISIGEDVVSNHAIDANFCRTETGFHRAMAKEFAFPVYYGSNLSALEDCFYDIRLREGGILVLTIGNSGALYASEPEAYLDGLLDTFESIGISWREKLENPVVREPRWFFCILS